MAYPVIDAPYGMKPINLIGGQVFAGSTREYKIPNGYGTNIFYGDVVGLTRGNIQRLSVTTGTAGTVTGIFLGCRYIDPVTKNLTFSQYYPASTASGDSFAIVCDDPDTIFKIAVCSATTVMASGAQAMVGQNLAMINNAGSTATGNSANAALAPNDTPATTSSLPLRVIAIHPDTAVDLGTATYSSGTTTLTVSALPNALPVGTNGASRQADGTIINTGSFVDTAAAAGATSVVINQTSLATPNATLIFTQFPEILVKWNFGQHQYYAGTSIA
jgi:hypothetical protein